MTQRRTLDDILNIDNSNSNGKVRHCLDDDKVLLFMENISGDDDLYMCPKCNKYYLSNTNRLEKVEKDDVRIQKKVKISDIFRTIGSGIGSFFEGLFEIICAFLGWFIEYALAPIIVVTIAVGFIFGFIYMVDSADKSDKASWKTINAMTIVEKQGDNKIMFEKNGEKIVFRVSDSTTYDSLVPKTVVNVTYNQSNEVKKIDFPNISKDSKHMEGLKVISKDKKNNRVLFEKDGQQVSLKVQSSSLLDSFVEGSTYTIDLDDYMTITSAQLYLKE